VCNTNAMPCCDGDNCSTNFLLREEEDVAHTQSNDQDSELS
jgi:hypothetical protein